jgi:hypothetical protein
MRRISPFVVFMLTLCVGAPLWSQPPGPRSGPEFQVNTWTTGDQGYHSMGINSSGAFVIAWTSGQDGDRDGVFARRFDSSGNPLGADFQVNSYTTGGQHYPAVGVGSDGGFVVAWLGEGPGAFGMFVRRFDSSGAALDPQEFQADSGGLGGGYPSLAVDPTDGGFMVAWDEVDPAIHNEAVYARRFDSAGAALDPSVFKVNEPTSRPNYGPMVSSGPSGGFLVVWIADVDDPNGGVPQVEARRFESTGLSVDPTPIQVSTFPGVYKEFPTAGMDAAGGFVVAWDGPLPGHSGYETQILVRRFDSTGAPLDPVEFIASSGTTFPHALPSIGVGSTGDFVVAWDDYISGGSGNGYDFDVFARRFESSGAAIDAAPFQVNTYTTDAQVVPKLGLAANGDFVVAWFSYEQDGDRGGIYAQRFSCSDQDGDGLCDDEDIVITQPVEGETLTCYSRGAVAPPPVVAWSPGNYDRFRVEISWDAGFAQGSGIRSSSMLREALNWQPSRGQWLKACRGASPKLYLRVFGEDTEAGASDPFRSTYSNVVAVETITVVGPPARKWMNER